MSDDLDDLDAAVRRAMAALDGEAPAGYFESLPARTLARLDDPEIGELPGEPAPLRAVQGPPPAAASDEEDDQEEEDDDSAVFASQVMSVVGLRDLPDLAEPDAGEAPPGDRAAESSEIAVRRASSLIAVPFVPAVEDLEGRPASVDPASSSGGAAPVEVPARAAVSRSSAGAPRQPRSRHMRAVLAGIGAIAVAAVATIYLTAGGPRSEQSVSAGERAVQTTTAAVSPGAGSAASGSAAAAGSAAGTLSGTGTGGLTSAPGSTGSGSAAGSAAIAPTGTGSAAAQDSGSGAEPVGPVVKPVGKPSRPLVKRPGTGKAPSKGGVGKFGAELPDGVAGKGAPGKKLKSGKPRSDRTALSRDDIERAMTAVAGQARACFAGTQGTASLRVTVAPSGRIAQVAVTGPFAGTPAGACVERAVQAAAFPAWDGAAQSFDYSYLLSD